VALCQSLGNIIVPYTLSFSGQGKCAARDNDLPRSNFLDWDSATFSSMQTDGSQISPLIVNSRFPALVGVEMTSSSS